MAETKRTIPKRKKILISVAIVLVVIIAVLISACARFSYLDDGSADIYTLEEHIERISQLVEKRYFSEDSEYTGYELYPIYTPEEELRYFLIELQPVGFVYVRLNEGYSKIWHPNGMYTRSEGHPWARHRIWTQGVVFDENGKYKENLPYPGGGWNHKDNSPYYYRYYEVDEDGYFIEYECSHFKAANIVNEKRYFVDINGNLVPAIREGDTFINLVSMQPIYSDVDPDGYSPNSSAVFIPKAHFYL